MFREVGNCVHHCGQILRDVKVPPLCIKQISDSSIFKHLVEGGGDPVYGARVVFVLQCVKYLLSTSSDDPPRFFLDPALP